MDFCSQIHRFTTLTFVITILLFQARHGFSAPTKIMMILYPNNSQWEKSIKSISQNVIINEAMTDKFQVPSSQAIEIIPDRKANPSKWRNWCQLVFSTTNTVLYFDEASPVIHRAQRGRSVYELAEMGLPLITWSTDHEYKEDWGYRRLAKNPKIQIYQFAPSVRLQIRAAMQLCSTLKLKTFELIYDDSIRSDITNQAYNIYNNHEFSKAFSLDSLKSVNYYKVNADNWWYRATRPKGPVFYYIMATWPNAQWMIKEINRNADKVGQFLVVLAPISITDPKSSRPRIVDMSSYIPTGTIALHYDFARESISSLIETVVRLWYDKIGNVTKRIQFDQTRHGPPPECMKDDRRTVLSKPDRRFSKVQLRHNNQMLSFDDSGYYEGSRLRILNFYNNTWHQAGVITPGSSSAQNVKLKLVFPKHFINKTPTNGAIPSTAASTSFQLQTLAILTILLPPINIALAISIMTAAAAVPTKS